MAMILFLFIVISVLQSPLGAQGNKLRVITVATDTSTDGFLRFNRSANVYGLKLEVLGSDTPWLGGDIRQYPGGGQKVNLLHDSLRRYKDDPSQVILFVDSYDVVLTGGETKILEAFNKFEANIVFSAEGFCWPDASLKELYPAGTTGKRFLNSGGFIGYAPQLYKLIVSGGSISNSDDDQLFYTNLYLDAVKRDQLKVKLDHKATLFQNLNGASGDVALSFSDDGQDSGLQNTAYKTFPLIIHGNGPSKVQLNSLGNYLAKSWNPAVGCISCSENTLTLQGLKRSELPLVMIGLFVEHETPFLSEFLSNILHLRYPKSRLALLVHNSVDHHSHHVSEFYNNSSENYSQSWLLSKDLSELEARKSAIDECQKIECDYYFSVDSDARITNSETLINLIEQNRQVISPMLVRYDSLWSNFWAALSSDGFYARSFDYLDLVKNNRRGVWNVPYISQAYLINSNVFRKGKNLENSIIDERQVYPIFESQAWNLDTDMTFSKSLRDAGVFMFVSNVHDYGHLATSEQFVTKERTHPDLYELLSNRLDWERRYIHPDWSLAVEPSTPVAQPCPDVYWFPVVTETFTKHLIETMEAFGKWSDGSNSDQRLNGGYEAVPTRDIHMNQVGLEAVWLHFLRLFIRPVQEKLFTGYFHDPPKSLMNFVVRYRPDEQPELRPHHDSSTYTINLALNKPKIDYQGGGCRFIRYNCSVTDMRVGWSLIHPGRLTHYHEGLRVTSGTRYIMISFVDP
ncbi:Multifunctional procollagen lysine hydroxylase and glycosyltransferase LH3 [Halotydeus destructor]|nr:Multifunctional procollagen lysine hydroxylase and glycosyltransferase LH3 [Halotydeus destructor]